jgi:N-acetylglucosamine-6-phosphate deacetylase
MKYRVIHNGEVITPRERYRGGVVLNHRRIEAVFRGKAPLGLPADGTVFLDAGGHWIMPGFIDIHLHGGLGADFNNAEAGEVIRALQFHAARGGATTLLPAVITDAWTRTKSALEVISRVKREITAPEIPGVHLEGPFISPAYKGAHPAEHLLLPLPGLLEKYCETAGSELAMITLAPELPGGLEAVSFFARRGVVAALGHSGAGYEQVREAAARGLSHVIHTYSGMAGFHHRRPGTLGAALTLDQLSAEIIADGIHTHPAAVKLLYRAKGPNRVVLVTDASPAAGLEKGEVTLGGQKVLLREGASRLADGTLAGSALTMNRALAGAVEMAGIALEEAVASATLSPARVLGLEARKGSLEAGKDADVVVLNRSFEVLLAVSRGEILYNSLV